MTRTKIQLPDPLYKQLKKITDQQGCLLSEITQKAAERFITRFATTSDKHFADFGF